MINIYKFRELLEHPDFSRGRKHDRMWKKPANENRQRVGFLASVPVLLRRYGIEPAGVLRKVGLDLRALDDPEGTIAYGAMGLLMEEAARAAECPHFGLEVGREIRTATLGTLGMLMRNSPALRVALKDFAANQYRHAHGGVVYLIEAKEEALLGYAVYQPGMRGHDVICDGAAMGIFNVLCELVGTKQAGRPAVLLSRSKPRDVAFYRAAFGVEPSFDAEQTAIKFPRRWLDLPIAGAEVRVREDLEKSLQNTSPAGDLDLITHLRRELIVGIYAGDVSAKYIAGRVGIGRWTLDRRLIALGTSYQEILDETRCEFTQQLLANTRLEISRCHPKCMASEPRWRDLSAKLLVPK